MSMEANEALRKAENRQYELDYNIDYKAHKYTAISKNIMYRTAQYMVAGPYWCALGYSCKIFGGGCSGHASATPTHARGAAPPL